MKTVKYITLLLLILSFGCSTFKTATKQNQDNFVENLPDSYLQADLRESLSTNEWWYAFDNSELNGLINVAFTNNLDLAKAWTRLRQAESLAKKSGSAKYPDLSLGADAGYRDEKQNDSSEAYGLGLAASYELDIWGKIRASSNSKNLLTMATAEDVNATALLLSGSITDTWLSIKASQERLKLLEEQVKSNMKTLELLKTRWRVSLAASVDVYQQEQILAQSKSLIPQAKQSLEISKQQLAYLMGFPPQATIIINSDGLPTLPTIPNTGIPADLLASRPDIKSAWLRVESADWNVVAAKADRLPSISLTGSFSYDNPDLNRLFDNWVLNLVGSLTAPLIDGGRRRAEVAYQEALTDQSFIEYKDTVLNAMKEVENALTIEIHQKKYLANVEVQEEYAAKTLSEAAQRYQKGITDYLPVLSALTSKQNLERNIITIEETILLNRVALYKALGGQINIKSKN
ncbi:MAG: efflux transporter outer membrane subunit [Kiritimatiellae bacterium]|jgi:multidrug efflux system outer membrane protein|nr:efflux transporter outer membrane subunit [Kiritimatiellia bacterium]